MKRICPITFEWVEQESSHPYSSKGLRRLSPHLKQLNPLEYTQQGFRTLAQAQRDMIDFSGNQPKLAMRLQVQQAQFAPDPYKGRYLLKAQDANRERMPENEAITMHLASMGGIETAAFGLVDTIDESFALWSRRVDRLGQSTLLPLQKVASFLPDSQTVTTESVVDVVNQQTTFPAKERAKMFQLILFNFITANSGMHAGKWNLLTDKRGITCIAPVFGLRNTHLVGETGLESSLPLADDGIRLDRKLIYNYLGRELLQLPETFVKKSAEKMLRHTIAWKLAIDQSYLSATQKFDYQQILSDRISRLR